MSDDILTRIDETLSDVSGSMERNAVRFHPTAEGEVEHGCTVNGMRWRPYGAKNITEEVPEPVEAAVHGNVVAQLEDLAEHLDRALAEEMVPSGTSPGVSFADVAAGPVAGVDAAVDVRRRVQDGTAPAPDPVGDVLRAEVLRQGLTECEIDGVRWVHVDGAWRVEALRPPLLRPRFPKAAGHDTIDLAACNNRLEAFFGEVLWCGLDEDHTGPHRRGSTTWTEIGDQPETVSPLVDDALEPHRPYRIDLPTIFNRRAAPRPWWLRWLPGGRR